MSKISHDLIVALGVLGIILLILLGPVAILMYGAYKIAELFA